MPRFVSRVDEVEMIGTCDLEQLDIVPRGPCALGVDAALGQRHDFVVGSVDEELSNPERDESCRACVGVAVAEYSRAAAEESRNSTAPEVVGMSLRDVDDAGV